MLVAATDCSEEGAMSYTTEKYEGMIAETMTMQGHQGDTIHAYMARPLGPGPCPGLALVTHGLGWTEWYKESDTPRRAGGLMSRAASKAAGCHLSTQTASNRPSSSLVFWSRIDALTCSSSKPTVETA